MKANKLWMALTLIFFAGCLFLVIKIQGKNEIILEQEDLLKIHEGNTFTLRDDMAVLQDSLRLIRIGEIKIQTDSTSKN